MPELGLYVMTRNGYLPWMLYQVSYLRTPYVLPAIPLPGSSSNAFVFSFCPPILIPWLLAFPLWVAYLIIVLLAVAFYVWETHHIADAWRKGYEYADEYIRPDVSLEDCQRCCKERFENVSSGSSAALAGCLLRCREMEEERWKRRVEEP